MVTFRIDGVLLVAETRVPLPGLFVKAFDKDLLFDDVLGSATTDAQGRFSIVTELRDFREFFESRPDIYLKVYDRVGGKLLHSSEDATRWNAGRVEFFEVLLPGSVVGGGSSGVVVRLVDERGQERRDFDPGESIVVGLRGLQANRVHELTVLDADGRSLFASSLLSNAYGEIEPTVLWPQFGLVDLVTGERHTVEEAERIWRGRRLGLRVAAGDRRIAEAALPVAGAGTRPILMNADARGLVRNGFEVGTQDAILGAHRLPFTGTARVYLVPRQIGWHAGDRFEPVTLASGRSAFADAEVGIGGSLMQRVASAAELRPGAYDYIVRPLRYGYEDDEDFVLRATDFATHLLTGLVVRWEFMSWKAVLGGCSNTQAMSGRNVSGAPYFQFADTFELGEDIYAALDPAALMPGQKGKMVALYVVRRPVADYASVQHLPQLGGNAAVQKFLTQTDCINHNKRLLWSQANEVGEYDIVADFGNDSADPMAFVPDNGFNEPLDLVDGKFVAGFRVVRDAGMATDPAIAFVGSCDYDQSTQGAVTVADPQADIPSPVTVNLVAEVRFPADQAGVTNPALASSARPDYPLIVCVHGNGHNFGNYTYLLDHWARNGFIAASILLNGGMAGEGRARVLFKHIEILKARFGSRAQNRIGIMGHSRGGEGVVSAARLNKPPGPDHGIEAIVSLGPTDQYTNESLGGAWATPFLVIHGAMDGDVASPRRMGFSLYDRASGKPKSMLWLYGANHNRFNEINPDGDFNTWKISAVVDHPKIMQQAAHMATAKAYMTAFFRWHLQGATEYQGLFRGEWVPSSVAQAEPALNKIYVQYGDTVKSAIDDFEQTPHDWQAPTFAGTVSDGGTLPVVPQENTLGTLDAQSPHTTSGLLLRWNDIGDRLLYTPTAPIDASAFAVIAFRVGQKVGSTENTAGQVQDLYLTLKDGTNQSRSIRVDAFGKIPPQQQRGVSQFTVSALSTIRIPLHVYRTEVINTQKVDLTQIVSIAFDFKAKAKGEVEIDSFEFSN